MATTAKPIAPLEELSRLLPRITNRELYDVALAVLEEAAVRVGNYAELLGEGSVDDSVIEEGLALATRFDALYQNRGWSDRNPTRVAKATQAIWKTKQRIEESWNG